MGVMCRSGKGGGGQKPFRTERVLHEVYGSLTKIHYYFGLLRMIQTKALLKLRERWKMKFRGLEALKKKTDQMAKFSEEIDGELMSVSFNPANL